MRNVFNNSYSNYIVSLCFSSLSHDSFKAFYDFIGTKLYFCNSVTDLCLSNSLSVQIFPNASEERSVVKDTVF